jgi:hypothetical protein
VATATATTAVATATEAATTAIATTTVATSVATTVAVAVAAATVGAAGITPSGRWIGGSVGRTSGIGRIWHTIAGAGWSGDVRTWRRVRQDGHIQRGYGDKRSHRRYLPDTAPHA